MSAAQLQKQGAAFYSTPQLIKNLAELTPTGVLGNVALSRY